MGGVAKERIAAPPVTAADNPSRIEGAAFSAGSSVGLTLDYATCSISMLSLFLPGS